MPQAKKFWPAWAFRSLGSKLLFSFLLVVLGGGLASSLIGTRMVGNTIMAEAQKKVRHDLDTAWLVYEEKLRRIKDVLDLTAKRDLVIRCLQEGQVELLKRELEKIRLDYQLDILTATNPKGKVITRTRYPYEAGDFQGNDELVRRALKKEKTASTEIIPHGQTHAG